MSCQVRIEAEQPMTATMRAFRLCAPVLILLATAASAPTLAQPAPSPAPGDRVRAPAPAAKPAPRHAPQSEEAAKAARPVAGYWTSPDPIFDEGTYERINGALLSYAAIEVRGGWPMLPAGLTLAPGSTGPQVALLRKRLVITEDLAPERIAGETYDEAVAAAVRRFQARHGLPETGSVGPQTLQALNVPVTKRLRQLAASLDRLSEMGFTFGQRYVVVNIPGAVAEAVEDGRVARRYITVVGKIERPSPTLTTRITAVNLNPTWTVPLSIVKKDIVGKMRKDPAYIARMRMRLIDAQGGEIDPRSVDWNADRAPNFTIRQDSGDFNALGNLRIDMPNSYAVYMHDTNHRNLFSADYRFQSSGCTRVADVRDLAAWLLQDNPGWSRREIDAGIAGGKRIDIRLTHALPVAWIYLTGWADHDGTVQFREDIYRQDEAPPKQFMVDLPKPVQVSAARASGFVLQSDASRPADFKPTSYLDSH
jgi:murein L,D-transpeptidase YcbB/YkuD